MARIASLNILLSTTGNDYLAEKYGAVIANVQKRCISQLIKNTNLSGTPGAGTYEAKRFENKTSQSYGTARSGGAGQAIKATPVTVPVNVDKELIVEAEQIVAVGELDPDQIMTPHFIVDAVVQGRALTEA